MCVCASSSVLCGLSSGIKLRIPAFKRSRPDVELVYAYHIGAAAAAQAAMACIKRSEFPYQRTLASPSTSNQTQIAATTTPFLGRSHVCASTHTYARSKSHFLIAHFRTYMARATGRQRYFKNGVRVCLRHVTRSLSLSAIRAFDARPGFGGTLAEMFILHNTLG